MSDEPRRKIIPCMDCSETFSNMVQLKRHKTSGACKETKTAPQPASSLMLPPFVYDFEALGESVPLKSITLETLAVDGVHHSPGGLGSLGVFFLKLSGEGNNGVVVLKEGARQSAGDYFCSLLYPVLGVATPAMRVLSKAEFKVVTDRLAPCPCTSPGAADKLQYLKQNGAVLMEYAKGVTLKHPTVPAALADPVAGAAILRAFGSVIAVDVLINNFDRAPFVWSHQGNANNILIHVDGAESSVVAIDQYCTAIQNPEGLEVYLAKVKLSAKEALHGQADGELITRWVPCKERYSHRLRPPPSDPTGRGSASPVVSRCPSASLIPVN